MPIALSDGANNWVSKPTDRSSTPNRIANVLIVVDDQDRGAASEFASRRDERGTDMSPSPFCNCYAAGTTLPGNLGRPIVLSLQMIGYGHLNGDYVHDRQLRSY
jgi:hypothetical protein